MTLDFQTFDSLTVPVDSSAAAQIAAALPHSAVLKAFNTGFGAALAVGTTGEVPATVLMADENAILHSGMRDLRARVESRRRMEAFVRGLLAGLSGVEGGFSRRAG